MARYGGKRKIGVKRYPSGQIKKEIDPRDTVIRTRRRIYGLSEADAATDLAGYAIGRLALGGHLGPEWRPIVDAANGYVSATARYMRVKYPSWPLPKAMDFLSVKGIGGEPLIEEIERIIQRYERYRAILSQIDGITRMKFHSIAFDDVGNTQEHTEAVHKCAAAIIQGLQKPRK